MLELEPPAGQMPRIELAPGTNARVNRPDVALFGLGEVDLALGVRSFDPVGSAIAEAPAQFNRLDVDQNGYLDRDELKEYARFQRGLFEAIDVDGDDKIFWKEMEAYVRAGPKPPRRAATSSSTTSAMASSRRWTATTTAALVCARFARRQPC